MSGALAVRGLLFALLLFQVFVIGSYGNNNSEKSSTSCKSKSKAITAFVQNWAAEHQQATVFQSNCTFAPAPFPRSDCISPSPKQDEYINASLAMCYLHEGVWKRHINTAVFVANPGICVPTQPLGRTMLKDKSNGRTLLDGSPKQIGRINNGSSKGRHHGPNLQGEDRHPAGDPTEGMAKRQKQRPLHQPKEKGKRSWQILQLDRRLSPACRLETHPGSLLWHRLRSK